MEILISIMLVGWIVKTAVTDTIYARRGELPPRSQERIARMNARAAETGRKGWLPEAAAAVKGWRDSRATRRDRPRRFGMWRHLANRWEAAWVRVDEKYRDKHLTVVDDAPPCPHCGRPMYIELDGVCPNCAAALDWEFADTDPVFGSDAWRDPWEASEPVAAEAAKAPCLGCGHWIDGAMVLGRCLDCYDEFVKAFGPEPQRTPEGELYFGSDRTDPNGVRECIACQGKGVDWAGRPCPACRARQERRNAEAAPPPEVVGRTIERARSDRRPTRIEDEPDYIEPDSLLFTDLHRTQVELFGDKAQCADLSCRWCFPPDLLKSETNPAPAGDNPTKGTNMPEITGEALTLEQVYANLEAIGVNATQTMDQAQVLHDAADNLVTALENMAATMTSENANADTITGVVTMMETAKVLAGLMDQVVTAAEALHAISEDTGTRVRETDGLVQEAAMAAGGVASESYLLGGA